MKQPKCPMCIELQCLDNDDTVVCNSCKHIANLTAENEELRGLLQKYGYEDYYLPNGERSAQCPDCGMHVEVHYDDLSKNEWECQDDCEIAAILKPKEGKTKGTNND